MPIVQRREARLFFDECYPEFRYSIITAWLNQYRKKLRRQLASIGFHRLSFVLNWLTFDKKVFTWLFWMNSRIVL